ncbi:hypothetical protein K474DRAFT_825219 [Panus rudis PR-1116 ss-1]|nr:hypothetical protein K474DRAFT_825219 [Panus rudis PR-1116 ss-1]
MPDPQPQTDTAATVDADIAFLQSALDRFAKDPVDEQDIAELLRHLETADGIATGVENRLDHILEHLDALLTSLDPEGSGSTSSESDSQRASTNDEVGHDRGK